MSELHIPKYGSRVEHAIVRLLVSELDKAGYVPDEVWDGGEYVEAKTEREVLEAVFAVDVSTIHFASKTAPHRSHNRGVAIVCGNEEDCVSDYHCGDKAFASALERIAETIENAPLAFVTNYSAQKGVNRAP